MLARRSIPVFVLFVVIGISSSVHAIEEKIYELNGTQTLAEIEQKYKGMADVKITRIEGPKGHISIEFPSPRPFTPDKNDLFVKMATNTGHDQPDREFLIADPKTGRIFYLNSAFKVYKVDLVKPWPSKEKGRSISEIVKDLDRNPIIKKSKAKKETK